MQRSDFRMIPYSDTDDGSLQRWCITDIRDKSATKVRYWTGRFPERNDGVALAGDCPWSYNRNEAMVFAEGLDTYDELQIIIAYEHRNSIRQEYVIPLTVTAYSQNGLSKEDITAYIKEAMIIYLYYVECGMGPKDGTVTINPLISQMKPVEDDIPTLPPMRQEGIFSRLKKWLVGG